MAELKQIPVFPLSTVLFPKGLLPLRIFEPRYLTMVGECMKYGKPFGVVLAAPTDGNISQSGFHQIGTSAIIEDFDQLDDGNLGISCRGVDRFKVIDHRMQDDKLIIAEVEILETDPSSQALPAEFDLMAGFVKSLCDHDELKQWADSLDPEWESGDWLSCRLSEVLPLSMESRQALLEMPYGERLGQLAAVMRKNKML